ncbi:hypothetical protein [Saccharothrix yanglingensis]|nr:hypothetical protein [Saccharothrix yanglingensis]
MSATRATAFSRSRVEHSVLLTTESWRRISGRFAVCSITVRSWSPAPTT